MTFSTRPTLTRDRITGLILAGGQGSRMGGVDKGLELLQGRPLVEYAIERLRPQVGTLIISANRHIEAYARYGFPVITDRPADDSVSADPTQGAPTAGEQPAPDSDSERAEGEALPANPKRMPRPRAASDTHDDASIDRFSGPLAGIARGLASITTDWMLVVPCDAPLFPTNLAQPLIEALVVSAADLALAVTIEADGSRRRHPVFALIPRRLAASADSELTSGVRKLDAWYRRHNAVEVSFRDSRAFYNANTLHDLRELER
ncbi:MAG TPA: molybdenum cofactor guanylyltransferase [Pararobbsia sp.]|nr:molybdenum cofactor guanylyltransferase [Pararobbsia sp.]